jgi:methionyl-tRNA formyltransferase
MILFLTNNYTVTKPLILWLKKKDKVMVYNKKLTLRELKKINPDLIISYNYQYIIKKNILNKYKIINLHISYLPYNRGAHPNFWAYVENTPVGVSIHYIDSGIDTGDIITQKKVVINKEETLKSSYKKLHFNIQLLFKSIFNKIDKIIPKQQKVKGTFHLSKDLPVLKKGWNTKIKELKK